MQRTLDFSNARMVLEACGRDDTDGAYARASSLDERTNALRVLLRSTSSPSKASTNSAYAFFASSSSSRCFLSSASFSFSRLDFFTVPCAYTVSFSESTTFFCRIGSARERQGLVRRFVSIALKREIPRHWCRKTLISASLCCPLFRSHRQGGIAETGVVTGDGGGEGTRLATARGSWFGVARRGEGLFDLFSPPSPHDIDVPVY